MLYAIHGFTEDDLAWADVLEPTHVQHRTLLLPGHGHSPCADDTTLASVAADLAHQLPEDGSADLIGYSMGGRVALLMGLNHPERIRRLVLVSCCPGIDDPRQRQRRLEQDEALAEILEQDGIGAFVASWEANPVLKPGRVLNPADAAILRSRRLNQDPDGLACALRCLGQGRMEPVWDRLGELSLTCLLICGAVDTSYCTAMERMHACIPNSQLVVVDDCGHAVHREDPKTLIATTVNFLIHS